MKKKGLIISTIVMVVVLIASLTTATYAWFTTTASSTIENITLSVASGSDVLLGVTTTGLYVPDATQSSFVSGNLTAKHGAYSTGDENIPAVAAWDGNEGMSGNLNTGLSLAAITKASSTGTITAGDPVSYSLDAMNAQFTGSSMIKASGHGTAVTSGTYEEAVENWDYLHFTLGVVPGKQTVDTITLHLTINPTDTKTIIGMTAALHIFYRMDNGSWVDLQPYEGNDIQATPQAIDYGTSKTNISAASNLGTAVGNDQIATAATALNAGWKDVSINWGTSGTSIGTAASSIKQIEFMIYYCGQDTDCVDSALGSGATVYFTVLNTNNGSVA